LCQSLPSSAPRFFSLSCSRPHRHLHSFPTRRSSDLPLLKHVDGMAHGVTIDAKPLGQLVLARQALSDLVAAADLALELVGNLAVDRKSTRLNSSHVKISYAVFCLKKKKYHLRKLPTH